MAYTLGPAAIENERKYQSQDVHRSSTKIEASSSTREEAEIHDQTSEWHIALDSGPGKR